MTDPPADTLDSAPARLRGRNPFVGIWSCTADHLVLRVLAAMGPDYITVDAQHGLAGVDQGIAAPALIRAQGVTALLRVPALDVATIGKALDLGYDGVVVPMVDHADQAARAVEAAHHPPQGQRSSGPIDPSADDRRKAPLVIVQVETATAVSNVDGIAAAGVDGIYIGPADLSLSLTGAPLVDVGAVWRRDEEVPQSMAEAISETVDACTRHGIAAGLHCPDGPTAALAFSNGLTMATVGSELTGLRRHFPTQLDTARGPMDGRPS